MDQTKSNMSPYGPITARWQCQLELFWLNVSHSFRSLRRNALLTGTCFFILGLAITVNSTVFAIVKAMLLDPLPYAAPHQLVKIYEAEVDPGDTHDEVAPGNFYDWQSQSGTLQEIAAYGPFNGSLAAKGTDQIPEHIQGVFCSSNLFQTLGVSAAVGRVWGLSDDTPSATRTIILSHGLWRRRFASELGVIGQTLFLEGKLYVIIGVMPSTFEFPSSTTEFWIPMQTALPLRVLRTREDHRLSVIGRLKPGISIQESLSDLNHIQSQIAAAYNGQTGAKVEVYPLQNEIVSRTLRTSFYILWAAVGCVFLIACVNVANLLLTRATVRRRELAIRMTLGASRAQVVHLQLIESLMLAFSGALGGIFLARILTTVFANILVSLPRASEIRFDWSIIMFATALAVLGGTATGLLPAFSYSPTSLSQSLHESGRTVFSTVRRSIYRKWLISVETSLSFLLLIGAGLLLKSFISLQNVNPGFDTDHLLTMRITLPPVQYPTSVKVVTFFEEFKRRVQNVPGVQSVGLISWLPLAGQYMNTDFEILGKPTSPHGEPKTAIPRTADVDYFHVMRIPLIHGRVFVAEDRFKQADKAIVSESLATKYFRNEDPIGQYISFWKNRWQIIGIVGDVRKNLEEAPEPTVYVPLASGFLNFAALVVRSDHPPSLIIPIENEIAHLDPTIAVSDILTMKQLVSKRIANRSFVVIVLNCFAAVALLLAMVGLYGVISQLTAERTAEFGVRLALGARRFHLVRSVVAHGLGPALIGIVIGAIMALAAVRAIESMLFGVKPFDITVFGSVAAGLFIISFAASVVPALRTTAIDPAQVLRTE